MMINKDNFPIKLQASRAWRTYLGGALIDSFHGIEDSGDTHFPEEWIMSVVTARNVGREHILDEGLSKLADGSNRSLKQLIEENPEKLLGKKHFQAVGKELGVLVKLIDSAERLTIQVHPDQEMARNLFDSSYGKTESWYILGARTIDGQVPCIYLGFKEGITREYWEQLFHEQDIQAMLQAMHKFEVKEGDTIFIQGGVPHAIGAGCFLVEIQEPTDYTIRVERVTPAGFPVDDFLCHQGLGFETMFDCFSYQGLSEEEVYKRWFIQPVTEDIASFEEGKSGGQKNGDLISKEDSGLGTLIGKEQTPLFSLKQARVKNSLTLNLDRVFSGLYILEGSGSLQANGQTCKLNKGDQFFVPAETGLLNFKAKEPLRILQFYGPRI